MVVCLTIARGGDNSANPDSHRLQRKCEQHCIDVQLDGWVVHIPVSGTHRYIPVSTCCCKHIVIEGTCTEVYPRR